MLIYSFCALIFEILLPKENVVSGGGGAEEVVISKRKTGSDCILIGHYSFFEKMNG